MTTTHNLPGPDTITRVTFDNGITVLVYENFAAQSVVMMGSLRVGSTSEDPAQNGLAALTINALLRGTQTRDFAALASALEDIGADLSYGVGGLRSPFFGKALAEDLPVLVDVLADTLREPAFPPEQVERLRGEVLTGLQIRQQDTRYRAIRAFYETLYPAPHPLHYSPRGTPATVEALTLDAVRAFHARHIGPAGMMIVIVGAVTAADAVEIVRARLADWRNPDQPEPVVIPPHDPPTTTQRVFVPLAGKTQSDIVMGTIGPARSDPDWKAAQMVNSVFGQFGMMGRIGAIIREELGLAYYVYSQLEGGLARAPWSIAAGVNPANVELTIARITEQIERLVSEPVSDDELADNQSYFVGHLPLQLESNEGIAGTLHNIESFNLGLDYLVNYRATIDALTRDDLLAAARRYLNPNALVIAVAGPV